MCETLDLGIKWPHWHTLLFEEQVAVDMRVVCTQDVKEILLKKARMVYGKTWAANHECDELKEAVWLEPIHARDGSAPPCDEEACRGRRMGTDKTVRHRFVGREKVPQGCGGEEGRRNTCCITAQLGGGSWRNRDRANTSKDDWRQQTGFLSVEAIGGGVAVSQKVAVREAQELEHTMPAKMITGPAFLILT